MVWILVHDTWDTHTFSIRVDPWNVKDSLAGCGVLLPVITIARYKFQLLVRNVLRNLTTVNAIKWALKINFRENTSVYEHTIALSETNHSFQALRVQYCLSTHTWSKYLGLGIHHIQQIEAFLIASPPWINNTRFKGKVCLFYGAH